MFEEWGFLISEIWGLLALAALVGLVAGWLIFGGRAQAEVDTSETDRLRADLQSCRALQVEKDARIAKLQADLDAAPSMPAPATVPPALVPDAPAVVPDFKADTSVEDAEVGIKPATLDAPRDGLPDDLKQIKGVGLKMEKLCNALGFWHFEQIADWTPQEVAWVDANLQGFKGRVSRDEWVAQAKILAAGGQTVS